MAGNGSRTPGGSEKLVSTQKRWFFDGFFPFMFINSIGNPVEWDESQDFWRYVVLPCKAIAARTPFQCWIGGIQFGCSK